MTVKPAPRPLRLLGVGETLYLHRKTEQLGVFEPAFARLLLHVDRQAIRVSNVLAGMSQRIAMSNLFALTRDLVAFVEGRVFGGAQDVAEKTEALRTYASELKDVESYSDQAAARQAQIVYLKGMMAGLFVLFLLAPALAMLFEYTDVPAIDTTLFVGCLVAGAFGSMISVLMRMNAGKFGVTHEIGREYLRNLGFARPFIGSIFALVIYFAFQGELLQQIKVPETASGAFAFFIVSGFLVGFSERLAKEMLHSDSATLDPGADERVSTQPVARETPRPAARSRCRSAGG